MGMGQGKWVTAHGEGWCEEKGGAAFVFGLVSRMVRVRVYLQAFLPVGGGVASRLSVRVEGGWVESWERGER